MKTWKIATVLVVLALVAVGTTIATTLARGDWFEKMPYSQLGAAVNQINTPQTLAPITVTDTTTPTLYTPPVQLNSPGTRGWGGWGGCMGRWGWGPSANQATTAPTAVNISQATDIAQTYVASLNNADLKVTQVEEYTNNYYVLVSEKSTGNGAFELLVDKTSGIVRPEPGPNMMWNTKYTFGTGWCNWNRGTITEIPTVTADQAKADAQQYLSTYMSGTTTGDVTAFSGHYTVEVLSNSSPYGMLSVNAFTGQVWYHTWHGAFIQEQAVA